MDSKQHWGVLYFDIKQLSALLSKNRPKYKKNTKFAELQIAFVFALFCEMVHKKKYLIGIPTLNNLIASSRPTPDQIFDRKFALDEDFDIVVAPKEEAKKKYHRLQIVRFTGDVKGSTEKLFRFLQEKKFNIPKDENLLLLVSLEKDLQLNYIQLGEKLNNANVPYGQIFVFGEQKREDSKVILFCYYVFPKVKLFGTVDCSILFSIKSDKRRN